MDINTVLFLAKERQQAWLTRAAKTRLAWAARGGSQIEGTRQRHIPHRSWRFYVEAVLHRFNGSGQQPCVTCGKPLRSTSIASDLPTQGGRHGRQR